MPEAKRKIIIGTRGSPLALAQAELARAALAAAAPGVPAELKTFVTQGDRKLAWSLEKTGGVEIAAGALMQVCGDANPRVILAALMAFTMIVGLFMSNTVTAVLLAPVALTLARSLGVEPYPFAMGIAVAASTAFMTPVSSPVNTLVLGPGHYRFIDFVKIGVPFSVIVWIIGVFLIPLLFPFTPVPAA